MANTALDPKTPKDEALNAVQAAGPQSQRLIDLWLQHQNTSALLEVCMHGRGLPRKAARRALKLLERQGLEVPKLKRVARLGGSKANEIQAAWLLAPDPAFNVLLVLGRRRDTSSRWETAMLFLNEEHGVAQVQHGHFSQSGLKKALESIAPDARYKPTEVSAQWARYRIHRSLAQQRERGLVEPLGLTSVAELLEPVPGEEVLHPFDSEGLEVALEDATEMSRNSGELHSLPEFGAWLPPRAAIDEMLQEVGKQLSPGEQPDQAKLQQLLTQAVISATDRFFTPEERERLVRVMKDSALSVLAREGETQALRLAAAIQCIQNAGLITNPPSEVPFLKAFFEKAVAYLLSEGKGSLKIPIPKAAAARSEAPTEGAEAEPTAAAAMAESEVSTENDRSTPPNEPV